MATLSRDCTGVELIVTSQQCKYSYQLVTRGDSFINLEIIPGTVTIQESESSLWSANKFYEVETYVQIITCSLGPPLQFCRVYGF